MNRSLIFLLSFLLFAAGASAQFPVRVQVNVVQPVPPYLPQIKADIAGNRYGRLNQDISSHLSIILSTSGQAQQHIKLAGSIERVAPSPMGVSLRPDYQPAQPIILGPQQPMISLTKDMLQTAFGNFSENSLVWNNLDLNTLRQNGIDYKLPEGTYRVCVTAYDYDKAGFSAPLSAPGTGCAYFTICYTASAPQLILPVMTMLQSNSGFQDFIPHSSQVQFTWTPPATTCGVPVGALNYDLEIRRVFDGQTVSDAVRNPYVFHQQNIPTTTFFLDTLKYAHVLVPGQRYTIRVRANFTPMPGSPLEIANQGYSQIGAIVYRPVNAGPDNPYVAKIDIPQPLAKPIPISSILPGGYITESYSAGGLCPATMPISNTTNFTGSLGNQDLSIGSFKIHIDQATANSDGSYKGTGYITWHPFASDIRLKVSFDTLKVNTDHIVYGGLAVTSTDGSHPQWAPFNAVDPVAQLTGLDNTNYEAIKTRISDGAHLVNQVLGNDEVDFPLGLNTTLGSTPVTLAIMGISFKPACTNMNVLLNINCPDLGGWLSLGGTGFQVDPNKLLLEDKGGVLYLPQDHTLTLGGMTFVFDGCPGAGGSSVDTAKGTYVSWDGSKGLEQIVANADLQFTNASSIVAVDKSDKRLTTPATVHAKFSFADWNDWMASVAPTTNLELGSLPGFMISATGGFYDHSIKQNAAGMSFPTGYAGTTDISWQGLYMQDLTLQLPSNLTGNSTASFGFHNFILDNTGVTTTISADNILDIGKGNIGGWAFSIDHIGIGVVQDNFLSGMQMTGGIKIPLSDDSLAYTCGLNVGEGTGMNYVFSVAPKGNYNVKMWAASIGLQPNSNLTITNKDGSFAIDAHLNGDVTFSTSGLSSSLPDLNITLLSFQGMMITNHDPTTNGFGFDAGNWSFGGKGLPGVAKNNGPAPGQAVAAADQGEGDAAGADGGSQGSADGFSINFTGFKPYVNISSGKADIGMTFTVNAVLDESGLGLGGAATMDIYGTVSFPAGKTPVINTTPNIQLDSIAIDCNVDLFHVSGDLVFHRKDGIFGNDVKGHLDLTLLGTIEVDAAAVFGHVNGYNYWGLAVQAYWQNGIMFPPGLSLNGLGGGFHYNMALNDAKATIKGPSNVNSPEAIVSRLTPVSGTFGFEAEVIMAYLSPNVVALEAGLDMDFSASHGLTKTEFDGSAQVLSAQPPDGPGVISAKMTAILHPDPQNFNCTLAVTTQLPLVSGNIPIEFNVGADGNYLYIGTPAPVGMDLNDPNIHNMVTVEMGFDLSIIKADAIVYGYFDIGTQLPSSPYIPPAIMNVQDHDGNRMAQGVIDKFTNTLASLQMTNDNSHNVTGMVNNPGFILGAGLHLDASINLVVVSASGSLDIGFAAMLEHFNSSEIDPSCSPSGKIGFNNWYAMAMFYADLSADLNVGPFSVGSVNAGAVLAAGLVTPTWAEGDIWLDVHVLGVISFTGSASISIGSPCSPVKDPLANIQMIGDFGPRGKNGQPVDVTSIPYVIGNVPLDEDYTVMVNDETMRTYQFRVDRYDVTSGGGIPLGGAKQDTNGIYEVDIDHNEMLCGNATYNAHVVVSAYLTKGKDADPNKALVTQDTSFSFTTGPRPQTITLGNLIYSYPIANQRYLLKSEFGGKGNLTVAEDVGYLLNPGKPDDCSNPPPPSPATGGASNISSRFKATLNNAPTTQLLAKFIPAGAGDTLQTGFSYNYNQQASMGTLQFPLPAGLKNSQVYSLQIWVVPPQTQNTASVGASTTNTTLTQTVTEYTLNKNNVLEASQVTKQMVETNTTHTLNGSRQMAATDSARVIFSMNFGTSQYNRFADKMAAYGQWDTQDEANYALNMPIYNTATAVEPFDEFEIKDFPSTCTTDPYKKLVIPHLFNADVPWDPNAHNDQDAGLIYLYASGVTSLTHATVDLGAPDTRSWFGVPTYNLISLENMPYQPALSLNKNYSIQTRESIQSLGALSASQVGGPIKAGGSSGGNGRFGQVYINNTSYETLATANSGGAPKPPPGLLWKRDNIFYNDYLLLHDFIEDMSVKNSQLTGAAVQDLLHACVSCNVEQVNGYYGSITLTAGNWLNIVSGGQTLFWQDVNNFLSVPFKIFPPTPRRTLHFTYGYPSPVSNSGYLPTEASSTFSYKSLGIPISETEQTLNVPANANSMKQPTQAASSPQTQGSQVPMPVGSLQVKTTLLKKYNIH